MTGRELRSTIKLADNEGIDQATLDRIRRDVWDSMRGGLDEVVLRGELRRPYTPEELLERKCEDAIRQRGLPRSLRRVPLDHDRR